MSRVEISSKRVDYQDIELRMIKATVGALFSRMRGKFENFPSDYLVLDTETTGLSTDSDLITQIGFCLINERKIVASNNLILDWTSMPEIFPHDKLRQRMENTKFHVENKNGQSTGRKYHMSFEKMRNEGSPPREVLRLIGELLDETQAKKQFFVLHNGISFDCVLLERLLDQFGDWDFQFGENVLDSGMVAKSAQMNCIPWQHETIRAWSKRVRDTRLRNVFWALDTYCLPTYRLDVKYGLDISAAHDAEWDARATHYVFEYFVDIANGKILE